jgi:predicted RNase H-like HicB family nuclease
MTTMRVMGTARGDDWGVYLLQADDGGSYLAASHEAWPAGHLVVRNALTSTILLFPQNLIAQVRTAIALHNAPDVAVTAKQDEDGVWCAQAVLAPGVGAVGHGTTQELAVEDCNVALELLVEELRASGK